MSPLESNIPETETSLVFTRDLKNELVIRFIRRILGIEDTEDRAANQESKKQKTTTQKNINTKRTC